MSARGFISLCALLILVGEHASAADPTKSAEPREHRPALTSCGAERLSRAVTIDKRAPGCHKDAECTAGKNGRCTPPAPYSRTRAHVCTYDQCFADAECGKKSICLCRHTAEGPGEGHACFTGACRVDADCGAQSYCSPSHDACSKSKSALGYFCHTASDECTNDDDCVPPKDQSDGSWATSCVPSGAAGRWVCSTMRCPPPSGARP